nr:hypothetical protein [Sphingomonas sp.]
MRTIPVKDRNGDEFTLYEFQDRRFLRKVRRWKLCTGEAVQQIEDRLVVVTTGEMLVPVGSG